MSEPLSNLQLKKRLLGAGILVFLAALIIPILLGDPKHLVEQEPVEEQAVASTEFQSRIQPLVRAPGAENQGVQEEAAQPQSDSGLVLKKIGDIQEADSQPGEPMAKAIKIEPLRLDTLNNSQKPTVQKKLLKAAPDTANKVSKKTPATKKTTAAKTIQSGWVVQVGIFSQGSNAESFASTLRSDGYQPKISDAKSSSGKANKRVWLGPFSSKSEARSISQKFEKQTGNDGYVTEYPFKS